MKSERFDDLYTKIAQIVELTERVPMEMRNEVFRTLFDAATNDTKELSCEEEIQNITNNGTALKEFIMNKKPISNIERSLLFVYYLNQQGIKSITPNHISACYRICELDEPGNLTQNLRDACSARYGYLENIQNRFFVTDKGLDFCEN